MIRQEKMHAMFDHLMELQEVLQMSWVPMTTREHFYQAKREVLLGFRALADDLLESLQQEWEHRQEKQKAGESKPYGRKINIEE